MVISGYTVAMIVIALLAVLYMGLFHKRFYFAVNRKYGYDAGFRFLHVEGRVLDGLIVVMWVLLALNLMR